MTTQVTGTGKLVSLPDAWSTQINLPCGCRVQQCSAYSHTTAVIGGKKFTAGESLIRGKRCGSVVTMVHRRRSVYGLVKAFVRTICTCMKCWHFAFVTWFPQPVYPDGDPLTVKINFGGLDINKIAAVNATSLDYIQPARVSVSIDRVRQYMIMMRLEGIDTMPRM